MEPKLILLLQVGEDEEEGGTNKVWGRGETRGKAYPVYDGRSAETQACKQEGEKKRHFLLFTDASQSKVTASCRSDGVRGHPGVR